VRKLVTFLLLTLFGMPILSPLLALTDASGSRLPACCRRNGMHHCADGGMQRTADSGVPGKHWSAPPTCCRYPAGFVVSLHPDSGLAPSAATFAAILSHPAVQAQTESKWRVAQERSRGKRGPPFPARA
jgi:hypothetical protein